MSTCTLSPISAFLSTNLNSKITCFGKLSDRIVRSLGAPLITVEVHQDQLYENIAIACEMFSKFAGFTNEYLIFNSSLYEHHKGIRLDTLYTLANSELTLANRENHTTQSYDTSYYIDSPQTVYITTSAIASNFFTTLSAISGVFTEGLAVNQILDHSTYNTVLTSFSTSPILSAIPLSTYFTQSLQKSITTQGSCTETPSTIINNVFDYDLMDYRKVNEVIDFEEGSTSGVNTLFTIEQTLAQQTYFSYSMGNFGFDLISWYCVKNWLDVREKMLAIKRTYKFDNRTQYLRMYPEPDVNSPFYGVVNCYLERPLRDLIKEPWVYQYALALTKLTVAQVRGKYGNLTLFGGQTYNATDLFTQGLAEKAELEKQLYTGASAGFGDSDPASFFIG